MRIAFYAPLKAPTHPVPSGDRRMARLLMAALQAAGHEVTLASTLRGWDDGRHDSGRRESRAERLAALGARCAERVARRWEADPAGPPDLWFTYHLYYKAPDWIGPPLCRRFGLPYVVAEASHAAKRADGPFAAGHRAAEAAIRQAAAIVNLAGHDAEALLPLLDQPERLWRLRPFVETAGFAAAGRDRVGHRATLAERYGVPLDEPWLLAVGMMRGGDKERSYAILAESLARLGDRPWRLLVVGDGAARQRVEARLMALGADRVRMLGQFGPEALTGVYAAADLMVWPAVNEAYGMALLEAQAAGLPVVAGRTGGVPDVVRDGVSGLLPPVGDALAFSESVAVLLGDPVRRAAFAASAARIARTEHDVASAVRTLDAVVGFALTTPPPPHRSPSPTA